MIKIETKEQWKSACLKYVNIGRRIAFGGLGDLEIISLNKERREIGGLLYEYFDSSLNKPNVNLLKIEIEEFQQLSIINANNSQKPTVDSFLKKVLEILGVLGVISN